MEQEKLQPRNKIDFKKGKIYIIRNSINDLTYIGSTCRSLSQRMVQHRRDMNVERCQKFKLYKMMKELHKDNFYIELLENYPCNNRDELLQKEGEYIRKYQSQLNRIIAGRTDKEYRDDNKEYLASYFKEYGQNNKTKLAEYRKEYRNNNKEKIGDYQSQAYQNNKEKYLNYQKQYREQFKECKTCGCQLKKANWSKHIKTKLHLANVEKLEAENK